MSIEDWCIHEASISLGLCTRIRIEVTRSQRWGHPFSYTVTFIRDLFTQEQFKAWCEARDGRGLPRVVRVATRRNFADADRLAKRWIREEEARA